MLLLSAAIASVCTASNLASNTSTEKAGCTGLEAEYEEPLIFAERLDPYHKEGLPDPKGVDVTVELIVNEISLLSEITSEFELDIFFSEIWHDRKLAFEDLHVCTSNLTLDITYLEKIWQPNVCIVNSKQAVIHTSPSMNVFLILYSDGKVWRNCRMRVRAPCKIDLKAFPFDTQPCTLIFESYSYNANKVRLQWLSPRPDAVKIIGKAELPDFGLAHFNTSYTSVMYPNGRWDQLSLTFFFKRRYGFFVLQAYVPTYMVIFIAWINFWMDPKELGTRATLTISAFLAMTLQFGNVLSSMPRVSYIKAIDIWMLGGIIFLFVSLAELAIISFLLRSDRPAAVEKPKKDIKWRMISSASPKVKHVGSLQDTSELMTCLDQSQKVSVELRKAASNGVYEGPKTAKMPVVPSNPPSPVLSHNRQRRSTLIATKRNTARLWFGRWSAYQIDVFFLIAFPPSFLLFNLFYWTMYLPSGG